MAATASLALRLAPSGFAPPAPAPPPALPPPAAAAAPPPSEDTQLLRLALLPTRPATHKLLPLLLLAPPSTHKTGSCGGGTDKTAPACPTACCAPPAPAPAPCSAQSWGSSSCTPSMRARNPTSQPQLSGPPPRTAVSSTARALLLSTDCAAHPSSCTPVLAPAPAPWAVRSGMEGGTTPKKPPPPPVSPPCSSALASSQLLNSTSTRPLHAGQGGRGGTFESGVHGAAPVGRLFQQRIHAHSRAARQQPVARATCPHQQAPHELPQPVVRSCERACSALPPLLRSWHTHDWDRSIVRWPRGSPVLLHMSHSVHARLRVFPRSKRHDLGPSLLPSLHRHACTHIHTTLRMRSRPRTRSHGDAHTRTHKQAHAQPLSPPYLVIRPCMVLRWRLTTPGSPAVSATCTPLLRASAATACRQSLAPGSSSM